MKIRLLRQSVVWSLAVVGLTFAAPTLAQAKTKFYLTKETYRGGVALTACAAGYHMASLWEILDPSHLQYDTNRGHTTADSGSGPPAGEWAWIRTGGGAYTSAGTGAANCSAWTTSSSAANGTFVSLTTGWTSTSSQISPWVTGQLSCDSTLRVWCVR